MGTTWPAALLSSGGAVAIWLVLCAQTVGLADGPRSSGPASKPAPLATMAMTSKEFSEWVRERREECYATRKAPTAVTQAVMERLRGDKCVSDGTVLSAVNALVSFESSSSQPSEAKGALRFTGSLAFIAGVIPLAEERPALQSRLHLRAGQLLETVGERTGATQQYDEAVAGLTRSAVEAEEDRVRALVQMAGIAYGSGDRPKAESLYLKVLSFDWFKVEDAEAQHKLRDLYVTAGRGLIDCRRHNLKALKGTFFVPATTGILGPLLERAIEEADGRQAPPAAEATGYPASRPEKR